MRANPDKDYDEVRVSLKMAGRHRDRQAQLTPCKPQPVVLRPVARQARLRPNEESAASDSGNAPMSSHHPATRAESDTISLDEAEFLKDSIMDKLKMLDEIIPNPGVLSKVGRGQYEGAKYVLRKNGRGTPPSMT